MTDPARLTDEELAEIVARCRGADPGQFHTLEWVDYERHYFNDVRRLIADLRVARAEVERLRGEVERDDEPKTYDEWLAMVPEQVKATWAERRRSQ